MRYAVVIEKAEGYSALRAGLRRDWRIVQEVEHEICGVCFQIDRLKEDGLPVPAPTSIAEYVDAQ